ncbi:adenylate/guanylate cyclase domain-containing protein [Sphingomonas sp. BIUV-7]|uniref:Adenylate/guanylate cyclase domain-containing protein n=1 Tax=Sphingomonas natans TaxID=3063330 RepID=A0ABT8Y3B2_9SPHN|nr:adenylate/guanylate cyclase domain-containing protein [Sphingomonas sp. BIUV-7]MDO6412796.1 adenylate/guanylate cyclase domain-containing protein [Sphingomonas sp. BIUV-7]
MRANYLLIAIASVIGLFLAFLVSRGVTRPIARLREGARAVEAGRLDGEVPVTSSDEVGDVTRAFNDMLAGLRSKERIKETFGQYVDPRIVTQLIDGEASATKAGTKQIATLFFSDIAGFTELSETLTPAMLVTMINEYFATMSAPIRAFDGIIDKYIGDSIMAFWVPPFADPADQAGQACRAALAQRDLLADFNARLPDLLGWRKAPHVTSRMSVTTGEVVVGSIGPGFARSFTVMGDTVNLASRLEGTNKAYGTCIIVDPETVRLAGDAIETRLLDTIRVVGRDTPIDIYELIGMAGAATPEQRTVHAAYADALGWYRDGAWDRAEQGFVRALELRPEDGPSAAMLGRIRGLHSVPPEGWAGVWRMLAK